MLLLYMEYEYVFRSITAVIAISKLTYIGVSVNNKIKVRSASSHYLGDNKFDSTYIRLCII